MINGDAKVTKKRICWDRDTIYSLYWDEEMSMSEIAAVLDCSAPHVYYIMKKLDIPSRSRRSAAELMWQKDEHIEVTVQAMKDAADKHREKDRKRMLKRWRDPSYRQSMLGPGHPKWSGGKKRRHYPPEFNGDFRQAVQDRDENVCIICGIEEGALHVHHIDYDKQHTEMDNCVTLCVRCHGKVHPSSKKKRQKWIALFKEYLQQFGDD